MTDWLLEPFAPLFMQKALLAVLLCAVTGAWLGVHVVLRRLSFFGDALAHATLPGVVLAYLLRWPMLIGALISAVAAVVGVGWAARSPKTSEDSSIGVFYTGLFALGVIGVTRLASYRDLTHILIGNPLGVSDLDLGIIAVCALLAMLVLTWSHRLLTVTLIDEEFARSVGQSPVLARMIVLGTAAAVVVVALSVAGAVLTIAFIITPAAIARLLCHRIVTCILMAMAVATISGVAGLLMAWYLDWSAGASIVVVLTGLFVLVRGGTAFAAFCHQRRQMIDAHLWAPL